MKLKPVGSNMTVLEPNDNLSILFSYETPVAAWINERGYVKTSKFWSVTTSRHINKWVKAYKPHEEPQEFFDNLVAGVK